MTDRFNLIQSFTCNACGDILNDPITLSCGFTVCSHCFPVSSPNSIKKSVFKCPVSQCTSATHLFGPELLPDVTVSEIANIIRQYQTEYDYALDTIIQGMIPHLKCQACTLPVSDAVTTPCGHTFCRLCILQSKIDSDTCTACMRPLPRYNTLSTQAPNHLICNIMKEFELSGLIQSHIRETSLLDSVNLKQYNVPLFVSGKVILPGQNFRLPIFEANHVRMFRNALIPSSRYNSLCLAAVHRNNPEVAQFGTIIQIVNVEHRSDAIVIEVVGVDRFKLETHNEEDATTINGIFEILHEDTIRQLSIELPNAPSPNDEQGLIRQREHITQYAIDLAASVIKFVHHLGSTSTVPKNVLHAQTNGLLGPAWLENMISVHGPIPPKEDPIAVVWWVAAVLPTASSEIYILLRTIPIIDRLELVISWLQNLQSQWETCRNTAINAFNRAAQYQV